MPSLWHNVLFILVVAIMSCRPKGKSTFPDTPSHADFEVAVEDECFIIRLVEPHRITEARRIVEQRKAVFPIGRIRRGNGGFNQCGGRTWSWHIDPTSVEFAEMAIEACDARPSYVEDNLQTWTEQVGNYCPWGGRLVREIPR
ncbi:MAG: hypothetical protein NZ580_04510 [Bacteroidia bacterium]|nr:hypothetical protein [Bacteroidia bacterium]MDW8236164.1 hypothetical protein [Bacteroidia bacterium]